MKKLDPRCVSGVQQMAMTNRGHLIPCCYMDTIATMKTEHMQKLLKVSKVSEHNSIKDIVLSDEWLEFCENLKKDIAPPQCFKTCGTREVRDEPLRVETVYTVDDGKVKHVEKI